MGLAGSKAAQTAENDFCTFSINFGTFWPFFCFLGTLSRAPGRATLGFFWILELLVLSAGLRSSVMLVLPVCLCVVGDVSVRFVCWSSD